MNRVGLAIDVSHSSDRTCLDVFAASDRPVLLSHTGARAIWPSARLATDEILRECAATGGLIGIYMPPNSTISRAHRAHSVDSVLDHVVHCAELVGVDHVAFGPDTLFGDHVALHRLMPSVFAQIPEHESVPFTAGLENPAETFLTLVAGLFGRGFSSEEILLLIGGNAIRVLSVIFGPVMAAG